MTYIFCSDLDLNDFDCLHCMVYTFYFKGNRRLSVDIDLETGEGLAHASGCREDMLFPTVMEKAECDALFCMVQRKEKFFRESD